MNLRNRLVIALVLMSPFCLKAQFLSEGVNAKASPLRAAVAEVKKEVVDAKQLYKVEKINIQQAVQPTVRLKNVQYKTVTLSDRKIKLPKDLQVKTLVSIEQKRPIAFAFVPQYIQDASGAIKKLVSYELDVTQNNASSRKTKLRK